MRPSGVLAGRRILITRAANQAGRLEDALAAKGAEVLRLATIEIAPPESYAALDEALKQIQSFDWLILTSANGAAALGERMRVLQISRERIAPLQVAAIGPATAEAARTIGLTVHSVPEEYVAETVAEALREKTAGRRVLLVRAAVGRDVIPAELAKAGAQVQVVEAYRTVLPAGSIGLIRELLDQERGLPDAVTFTSSSTVTNFFTLLRAAGLEPPPGLLAVSIGPVTSRTLREHDWEPAAEAAKSDIPGLVAACEALLAGHPPRQD